MRKSAKTAAQHRTQVVGIIEDLTKDHLRQPRQTGLTSETQYRHFYRQGRIDDSDLSAAFSHYPHLHSDKAICAVDHRVITRQAIYRIALAVDLSAIGVSQFIWWREEMSALDRIPPDVPDAVRVQLLTEASEAEAIRSLWAGLVNQLDLPAKALAAETAFTPDFPGEKNTIHDSLRQLAHAELEQLFANLGNPLSLVDLVQSLSGVDILEAVNLQLQRICVSMRDADSAAWTTREHQPLGLYGLWRTLADQDASLFLHQLPDWRNIIAELPIDAVSAIVLQLQRFDIPHTQWPAYLHQLALELPDWTNPRHPSSNTLTLADLLAIRLTLDRLWLNQVCHDLWKIEAKVGSLQGYFHKNLSEFWVRLQLYQGLLPEYLAQQAEDLIIRSGSERQCRTDWQQLADVIWLGQPSLTSAHSQENSGWRLFRLCQHLGLNAHPIQALEKADLHTLLSVLDGFNQAERQKIWLYAHEHHYRQALLARLNNHQESVGASSIPPQAQVIFVRGKCAENLAGPLDFTAVTATPDTHRFSLHRLHHHLLLAYLGGFISAPLMLANILVKTLLPEWHCRLRATITPLIPNQTDSPPSVASTITQAVNCLAHILLTANLTDQPVDFIILAGLDPDDLIHNGLAPPFNLKHLVTLANQPEIRTQLSQHGIIIPERAWLLAVSYDTAKAALQWHDFDKIPVKTA